VSTVVVAAVSFRQNDSAVLGLDATDGSTRWSRGFEPSTILSTTLGNGKVFVAHGGALTALDARDGATLWNRTMPTSYFPRLVWIPGGTLAAPAGAELLFLDAGTGETLASVHDDAGWVGDITLTGDVVLARNGHGNLSAIAASTHAQRWNVSQPTARPRGA